MINIRSEGIALEASNAGITMDAPVSRYKVSSTEHDILPNTSALYRAIKRLMDIFGSAILMIFLMPFMLITALAIKIEDPKGKIIFKQLRCSKGGKTFYFYKFRSMCANAEELKADLMDQNEMDGPVFKIKEDPRITKVGKFIRKTSIDELPQLYNVFKGDMSLVGPRPPLPNEVKQYNKHQLKRLLVKPGITCYWQVGGRNHLNFEQWVELDIKYIQDQSLWTDITLLFKTIPAVFKRHGAS